MATTSNTQKIPVCVKHKTSELNTMKCACGSYMDLKHGKYGPFFLCIHCGPINMRKALDVNPIK